MRSPTSLLASLCLATLTSCGTPYTVVMSTDPGPLDQACPIDVIVVDHEGLLVGGRTEAEYLERKNNASEWADKKAKWAHRLEDRVRAHTRTRSASGKALKLAVNIEFIETGFYALIVNRPATVRARIRFLHRGGKTAYEVVTSGNGHGMGDRVGACYETIGARIARFMTDKLAAAGK